MRVLFSYDTEDFVTPESDDALLAIAQTLRRHGIRASFAVVGDKARALWTRRRRDVIEAVAWHDVQYHANTHLCWPQTTVEVSRMKWDEGVEFVVRTESHGVEDVAEVFGQRPVAWIRNGGNWAPQELYGGRLLGLAEYVPSRCLLAGGRPTWYVNVLNARYDLPFEHYFSKTAEDALRDLDALAHRFARSTLPVVVSAHPCMFATERFYDLCNMERRGVFPPKEAWRPAPVLPVRERRRRIALLDAFAGALATRGDVAFATHRDVIAEHAEPTCWLSPRQLVRLAAAVQADFNYQKVGRGYLSVADIMGALSLALQGYAVHGRLPARIPVRRLIGPPEPTRPLRGDADLPEPALLEGVDQIEREADRRHRIPSAVRLRGKSIPPSSFLMALAQAAEAAATGRPVKARLSPQSAYPRVQAEVFPEVRVSSTEIPEEFDPGAIETYTWQQTWTLRPAVAVGDGDGDGV